MPRHHLASGTLLALGPVMLQLKTTGPALAMRLEEVHAPLIFCSAEGEVLSLTPPARDLLSEMGVMADFPGMLPRTMWSALSQAPAGEALEWRPPSHNKRLIGCTRYRARGGYLLILKEISGQHVALSQLLQRQRLEVTGRLVASIAHELRNSVASIIYSANLIKLTAKKGTLTDVVDASESIQTAAQHLEGTVRGLLDYSRPQPTPVGSVDLDSVMNRAFGFLRSVYREGSHRIDYSAEPDARRVRGNTIGVEQIFINLLLNSAEAASAVSQRVTVRIRTSLQRAPGAPPDAEPMVRVQVADNGPGIPSHQRELIFQPFFTTSQGGTGLGLTNACDAVEFLGGKLVLEPSERGACFSAYFQRGSVQ